MDKTPVYKVGGDHQIASELPLHARAHVKRVRRREEGIGNILAHFVYVDIANRRVLVTGISVGQKAGPNVGQ